MNEKQWSAGFAMLVAYVPERPPRKTVYLYPPEGSQRQVTHLRATTVERWQEQSLSGYRVCLHCERYFRVSVEGEPANVIFCCALCHAKNAGQYLDDPAAPDRKRRKRVIPIATPEESGEIPAIQDVTEGLEDAKVVPC